jgi:hypothetical protein
LTRFSDIRDGYVAFFFSSLFFVITALAALNIQMLPLSFNILIAQLALYCLLCTPILFIYNAFFFITNLRSHAIDKQKRLVYGFVNLTLTLVPIVFIAFTLMHSKGFGN